MERIDLEDQKKIAYDILKELKRICEKNNIKYFLGGGTMLGAIRHQGFIPWDDDIDVMLPRKDYEKLVEIFNKECNKNYRLLDYRYTDEFYQPFDKIVDLRTYLVEYRVKDSNLMGMNIDVFPIDFLPEDEKQIKKIFRKYKFYKKLELSYKFNYKNKKNKKNIKNLAKMIIGKFVKNYEKLCNKINGLGVTDKETNMVACISGIYYEKEIMNYDYMKETIYVQFEDDKFPVPSGYELYLTKHYGNYMELPPKEKQISHNREVYWR